MTMHIGLVLNFRRKHPILKGKELISWFNHRGINVYTPPKDGQALGLDSRFICEEFGSDIRCLLTLGGDGTFLRAARLAAPASIPILGINMGVLGFLTEVEIGDMNLALEKIIRGEYSLEDRTMLEALINRNGQPVKVFTGLNDVVINKGLLARLISLEIYVEKEYVTTYKADGVIIASPTGSTAYSLSAGGPIATPEVDVTIITPICPHTLMARPLVIPGDKTVRVTIVNEQPDSMVTIDGQDGFELQKGDEIIIKRAAEVTRMIRLKEHNFFSIVREKFNTEVRVPYE